jgi:hypothetical protein
MCSKRSNVHLFTSFSFVLLAVLFGLWLNATPANAVVAPHDLDSKTAPSSICYIEMWDGSTDAQAPDGDIALAPPSSACSGTLISNNRVLTAAHCIPAVRNSQRDLVTCGNGIDSSIKGYASNPAYENEQASADLHDVAVLDLESPQKPGAKHFIAPLALASTQAQINTILSQPANCNLWGYGRNDDSTTDNSWGTLRGANIDYLAPSVLEADTGWIDSPQDIYVGPEIHAAPGDSGGPIICQAADGSLVQIATTMIEGHTTVGPIPSYSVHEMTYFNIDWINAQIALDHLPNN